SDGSGPWTERGSVAAGASITFFQPANAELPEGFVGSAAITSLDGAPIIAIVNEVNPARDVAMTYRALGEGAPTLSAPYLSRGHEGWATGAQIQNLGSEPTTVSLQLRNEDGTLLRTLSELVPPTGSRTFF